MLSRKSRRRRDPSPMFPFGEIMLPVIGLVALGLLIVAVKMFFIPSGEEKTYGNIPQEVIEKEVNDDETEVVQVTKDDSTISLEEKAQKQRKEPLSNSENDQAIENTIAVPVEEGTNVSKKDNIAIHSGEGEKSDSSQSAKPGENLDPKESSNAVKGDLAKNPDSRWGVQIGSFKDADAARSLSSKAKQTGYSVRIEEAVVNGTKYHRVIISAGSTKAEASDIQDKLKQQGYPTFLKRAK